MPSLRKPPVWKRSAAAPPTLAGLGAERACLVFLSRVRLQRAAARLNPDRILARGKCAKSAERNTGRSGGGQWNSSRPSLFVDGPVRACPLARLERIGRGFRPVREPRSRRRGVVSVIWGSQNQHSMTNCGSGAGQVRRSNVFPRQRHTVGLRPRTISAIPPLGVIT